MTFSFRLCQTDHERLFAHLFPGDGNEAIAIGLCGRRRSEDRHILTLRELVAIPYGECAVRTPDRVTWPTRRLTRLLEEAAKRDLAVIKIHSHPGGYEQFSSTDDASDADIFDSVYGWTDSDEPHASAVMLPDGRMFGRVILPDGSFQLLGSILVAGDDILYWTNGCQGAVQSFARRHAQLFGSGTTHRLRQMAAAVVGCSGTGSPLIEQLARLGIGRLVLIDPDHIEEKNLNRILNATLDDAARRRLKVDVMKRSIDAMGLGTVVKTFASDLATPETIKAVGACDLVFGCMDGVEGRHLLNRLAAFYLLPYFDLGVRLDADGTGGIEQASAAVHYVKPDGASLLDRGVYDMAALKAAGLRRTDPDAYREQVKAGYLRGVDEDRPAVISINMHTAAVAVNEFLARLHPFRLDANADSAIARTSFSHPSASRSAEPHSSGLFAKSIGKADVVPLLGMPELSEDSLS